MRNPCGAPRSHTIPSGSTLDLAYQRGEIIDKRRQLMQAWADYCETGKDAAATSNVVALRA
jgi:hypothetical protein